MNTKRELTANDILDTDAYIKVRKERRAEIISKKNYAGLLLDHMQHFILNLTTRCGTKSKRCCE